MTRRRRSGGIPTVNALEDLYTTAAITHAVILEAASSIKPHSMKAEQDCFRRVQSAYNACELADGRPRNSLTNRSITRASTTCNEYLSRFSGLAAIQAREFVI